MPGRAPRASAAGDRGGNMSRLAVVTGASSDIGLELARLLESDGFEVIAVAEDEAPEVGRPIRADLATPEGVEQLAAQVRALPIDALVLNAGIGAGGALVSEKRVEDELRLIDLNVRSTVHLAKLLVPPMVARGEGRVLFTSSIASTLPGPYQVVYNASKSFMQSFALALRNQLKDSGVTVTSLMPGPTGTEFFERADVLDN